VLAPCENLEYRDNSGNTGGNYYKIYIDAKDVSELLFDEDRVGMYAFQTKSITVAPMSEIIVSVDSFWKMRARGGESIQVRSSWLLSFESSITIIIAKAKALLIIIRS